VRELTGDPLFKDASSARSSPMARRRSHRRVGETLHNSPYAGYANIPVENSVTDGKSPIVTGLRRGVIHI